MWSDIVATLIAGGPVIAALAIAILAGAAREWWVWGHTHRRVVEEKDWWRAKFFETLVTGEQAVRVASDMAEEQP